MMSSKLKGESLRVKRSQKEGGGNFYGGVGVDHSAIWSELPISPFFNVKRVPWFSLHYILSC